MAAFLFFTLFIVKVFGQDNVPSNLTATSLPNFNNMSITLQPIENRNIERPCEVLDMFCIRKYFASHSQCKEVNRPFPKTLYRPKSAAYFSRINLTIIYFDKMFNIQRARISEFYINKKTDNLVLAVEFVEVEGMTNTSYYRYHRRGREPVTTMDFYWDRFSSYVVTVIIPNIKNLQLNKGETFVFVNDATPRFVIGPRAYISEDPGLTAAMANIYTNVKSDIQEYYFSEGAFFIGNFIQRTVCHFGLQLY